MEGVDLTRLAGQSLCKEARTETKLTFIIVRVKVKCAHQTCLLYATTQINANVQHKIPRGSMTSVTEVLALAYLDSETYQRASTCLTQD